MLVLVILEAACFEDFREAFCIACDSGPECCESAVGNPDFAMRDVMENFRPSIHSYNVERRCRRPRCPILSIGSRGAVKWVRFTSEYLPLRLCQVIH